MRETIGVEPTQELSRQFREDGFVLVRDFFSPQEVDELEENIDRYIAQVLPTIERIHVVYESGWSGPIKQFSRLERYDSYFANVLNRPDVIQMLSACLGAEIEPLTTEVFYKPARVGSPALYHQENAYFNYLPPYGIVAWIALDDTTLENGAVHFARGSHRLGELPHAQTGKALFSKALDGIPDKDRYPEVPALLRRGDASIHHFLTIHRSGPNITDRNRRGFVLDYKAKNALVNQETAREHQEYKEQIFRQEGAL